MTIPIACECGRLFEAPEEDVGGLARCPECGREASVPKPTPPPDDLFTLGATESSSTSGKAVASLALGSLFFLACLGGIPAILLGRAALRDIDRSGGRLGGRRMARAGVVLGVIGCLATVLLLPAVRTSREAARRAQCTNNLKQIGLAIHNYLDTHECLPPAAITDEAGKPLLSWRVAILPFIESNMRHSNFHLDEPWDSPHNLTLLDPVPNFYACPSDSTLKPGMTGYQVVIGPNTAFPPDFRPLTPRDFADGLGNTIFVGESRHAVPWTKPEDLTFDATLSLPQFGSFHGHHNNGFNVLLGDGSVRFLTSTITPRVLGSLLTRDGSDPASADEY